MFVMYVARVSQKTVHYEGILNVISSAFSLGVRLWVKRSGCMGMGPISVWDIA